MIARTKKELDQVRELVSGSIKPISIDVETNWTERFEERYIMGISLATDYSDIYIPVRHLPFAGIEQENAISIEEWITLFEKITCPIIFHNAKFDLQQLTRAGFNVPTDNVFDTMLIHHYIDAEYFRGHSLDALSDKFCKTKKDTNLAKGMKDNWDSSIISAMAIYACTDTRATLELYHALKYDFKPFLEQWETYDREFVLLLQRMENRGQRLDKSKCRVNEILCRTRMRHIKEELNFDVQKPSALISKFFGEPPVGLGLKPLTYTKKKREPQVNTAFLEQCNHPVAGLVLEYKGLAKQASSYFGSYLELVGKGDRLHPNFKIHGTKTGRLSCENPNLQQVPRESDVKKMFLPDEGYQLWEIDYRNLELRLTAVYSNCAKMIEAFQNEEDVHQQVADQVGVSRQIAKIVNFLITYGGGVRALSTQANITLLNAKITHANYKKQYPEIFKTMHRASAVAEDTGQVKMFNGRVRHLDGTYDNEHYKAFNAIIQGGGFEIVKRSMLLLDRAGYDIRNQVHDSVWLSVKDESELDEAERLMTEWTTEAFGLTFSVDRKRLR